MAYIMILAHNAETHKEVFSARMPADPMEPNWEFCRLVSRTNSAADTFGTESARRLHELVEGMFGECVWEARVSGL